METAEQTSPFALIHVGERRRIRTFDPVVKSHLHNQTVLPVQRCRGVILKRGPEGARADPWATSSV